LAKIDMGSLVQDSLRDLASAIADRGIEVQVGKLPLVRGDRQMLQRVWSNLLENAIKFSGAKPNAVIEVGARASDAETEFFVKDSGVGFDMRFAGKLFGVFQRLHGVEEFPGTGIGLAIVHRIVTRHGGRVSAEGKVGTGATFRFTLPHAVARHA
jgi:two-component system, chemotaxis family, sensor kinase Cph1